MLTFEEPTYDHDYEVVVRGNPIGEGPHHVNLDSNCCRAPPQKNLIKGSFETIDVNQYKIESCRGGSKSANISDMEIRWDFKKQETYKK